MATQATRFNVRPASEADWNVIRESGRVHGGEMSRAIDAGQVISFQTKDDMAFAGELLGTLGGEAYDLNETDLYVVAADPTP